MKKILFSLAMLLLISGSSVMANPADPAGKKLQKSFDRDFVNAQQVQWQVSKDLSKVSFTMDGYQMSAWYHTNNGKLISVTRNIKICQLPISLLESVRQEYADYRISELFEILANNKNTYYITLEGAAEKLGMESVDGQHWNVYLREEKRTQ